MIPPEISGASLTGPGDRIQETGFRIQDSGDRIQDSGDRIQERGEAGFRDVRLEERI
ncbi:MAG: hypothetical protein KY459_15255 [Acidobacteria bacterium]|nr:hypothetical protein [Acidobacteriota bacterium]